jgi:hypothetical protein
MSAKSCPQNTIHKLEPIERIYGQMSYMARLAVSQSQLQAIHTNVNILGAVLGDILQERRNVQPKDSILTSLYWSHMMEN